VTGLPFLRHEDRFRPPSAVELNGTSDIYLTALADDLRL